MSTILVTGGSGFIGTHLCRKLIQKGHQVRVLDLVLPEAPVSGVEYCQGDIRNPSDLIKTIRGADAVYHFAALVSVPYCQEHPIESDETNLLATTKILEEIRRQIERTSCKIRLIFSGSSVVYGNSSKENEPHRENGPLAWPPSFYGAQKLGSEYAVTLFHKKVGIPAIVFRFFNVFGPGQDPTSPYSGVISIFSRALKERYPMRLNGGGFQTRDFVSVHDISDACMRALEIPESYCDGKAINLGTGQSISVRKLAEEMALVAKQEFKAEVAPARPGDILHSMADIQQAKEILGWSPKITLRDGLTELLYGKS